MSLKLPQTPDGSPLLTHCPESLPALSYFDAGWFERERQGIWMRDWIYAGRANDLIPLTLKRLDVAGQNLILVKDAQGTIRCFHNTCRHRGSELCGAPERKLGSALITCPYHQWSYDLSGKLVRTAFATLTSDFKKEVHGLLAVAVREWSGFLFVCLKTNPPDFSKVSDLGLKTFDNWPIRDLVTGHTLVKTLNCNWKIFWENYNECLHCPGIHPELCDMVPVYREGIMSADERAGVPHAPGEPVLKPGANTWTMNGQPCGPEFPLLTEAERASGHTFVTFLPSLFVVAHVDYIRAVSLRPLSPEQTELRAEWLFPKATLSAAGFDLANVVDFASTVLNQDGAACEMNQRGLKAAPFKHGRLMPQEFEVHRFQNWVRQRLTPA